MRFLFLILACALSFFSSAQNSKADYSKADAIALSAPSFIAANVDSLANYLTQPFNDDELKVRSIFRWVTNNIAYDTKKQLTVLKNPSDKSQTDTQVLRSRKAICEGYSELLKSLCDRVGVKAVVVEGIATPDKSSALPHAWNAIKINGQWKLIDATWAAGGVDDKSNVFKRHFFAEWFFPLEKNYLNTHYPEDPMWQLVPEPINRKGFLSKSMTPLELNFSYQDTITQFLYWTETDTLQAFLTHNLRILRYDPDNKVASNNTKTLYNYREYKKLEQANEVALKATNDFNGIVMLVNMAKKRRKPKLLNDKEAELLPQLLQAKSDLINVIAIYKMLKFTDNVNDPVLYQNIKQTEENIKMMSNMEDYLKRYFNTPTTRRLTVL